MLDGDVGMWIRGDNVRVGRVMSLLDKDGRNTFPPLLFDRSQDASLLPISSYGSFLCHSPIFLPSDKKY